MDDENVSVPKAEYENTLARLKELEGIREKLLLSAADFENAKKRLAREREEFGKFSQENLIRHILPVLDNFERAIGHFKPEEENVKELKGIVTGIRMVYKQLSEILRNEGLVRIQSVGKPFDPHRHEAVSHVPESGPEDEIVEEVQAGYLLHDRLLRAAKVKVRVAPGKAGTGGAGGAGRVKAESQEEKQEELT